MPVPPRRPGSRTTPPSPSPDDRDAAAGSSGEETSAPAPAAARPGAPRRSTRPAARAAPPAPAGSPLKNPLFLGTAIATFAAVVVAVVFYVMHRDDDAAKKKGDTPTASSNGATPDAAAAKTGPDATASPNSAAVPTPAATVTTAEEVDAQLKDVSSADAAVAIGDRILRDSRNQLLAERAYKKALELDPESKGAKRGLEIRPLDPEKDFPGFDDVDMTKQRYLLNDFRKLRGKVTTKLEREAEVAHWNEKRPAIESRVKAADGDPYLTHIDRTRNQLAQMPFFEHFDYDVIESTRPYALFVEEKGESVTERDARREEIETSYKQFLDAHAKAIGNYLVKLSPSPPKEEPTFVVFFLLDRASYDRFFQEFEHSTAPPGVRAHYTHVQKWAFTYASDVSKVESADFTEGTQVLLHELTHAWVDQLTYDGHDRGIELVKTHWFNEGIAEYMSCQFLDQGKVQFEPWRSMRLKEAGQRPPGCRIPLERAFQIKGNQDLMGEAVAAADLQKALPREQAIGMLPSGFYADMSLFIFWVNYANDRKYKKQFEDYVRKELAGDGGPEVAAKLMPEVFGRKDLEAAIDAFQKQVSSGQVKFQNQDLAVEK